jgi:hypothetical protein
MASNQTAPQLESAVEISLSVENTTYIDNWYRQSLYYQPAVNNANSLAGPRFGPKTDSLVTNKNSVKP